MSVVYGESTVNSYRDNAQGNARIVVLADGSYVVVWESYSQDGASSYGIYGQRFSASGVAIGPEFRVSSVTEGNQTDPHIGLTGDGGFVVTWTDDTRDASGSGIYAQRFDASGIAQGGNVLVPATASGTQSYSDVVGYAGGYTVVWASSGNAGGSGYDIYMQRYTSAGVAIGGETRVSTVPGAPANPQTGTQYEPDVAAYANGNLVVVWTDQGGNDGSVYGVYGRLYNASTGTFSDTLLLNTTTANYQYEPAVATLADGGFVVVWRSDGTDGSGAGVYGQRFDASGAKVGAQFLVNQSTTGGQYQPDVTGLSTGGFVVTWYNDNYDVSGTGTTSDVYVREYDASGNPVTGQVKLLSPSNGTEYEPAIADLGNGNYAVVYTDYATAANGGNNTYEIVQQIFGDAAELPRQSDPEVGDFAGTVTFTENAVNAAPQVIDAAVSVTDIDSADFAGGRLDLFYVQGGEATDQLGVRHQGNGFGQIGVAGSTVSFGGVAIGTIAAGAQSGANGSNLLIDLNANATAEAVEALIQNLAYGSTSQSPGASRTVGVRLSDGDGGSSLVGTVTINVTPSLDGAPVVYGEERVNTYRDSTQETPDVAVLADGSYVIVWTSYSQDGASSYGIYGQRFSASGVAIGPEFRVNTLTDGNQDDPHVAAKGDGGFVVTWTDNTNDGSSQGVYAQRYDANGVAQGTNVVVPTTTSSVQYYSDVAGYTNGYAVVWTSTGNTGGSGYDIYLKRYDNAGNLVTAETRVSTVPGAPASAQTGTQYEPDAAAYANGNLVIVWTDQGGSDGNVYGIYGRLYNAGTGTFGDTLLLNTTTANYQYEPAVATLSDGGFVVVWRSDGANDGSGAGVYGQRFNASGAKVGAEFLVNETTTGGQYNADVTGLSTGGFVVSFYNDNYDVTGTGTTADVYIREYDAAGNPIDGQRKLISPSNSIEYQPAIADLGNGNFVVAYTDYATAASGANNTYEIVQQIFGSAAELPRQAIPEVGDFVGTVTFVENDVNAAPQVIDAAVSLTDIDSDNFAGGRVDLFYVQGGQAADQLGVRHQGTGPGQIGVSGSTVSYGGVAIGTIGAGATSGANGANLVVTLNANATVEAVEALLQNLTYGSTSQSPDASRTVGVRVSDGDGGSSATGTVAIEVTPSVDGAPVAYGESPVNSFVGSQQEDPDVAVLADGSYVVVWSSYTQDEAAVSYGVYGQRFSASGVAVGPEFRVNTLTSGNQNDAHVAATGSGFVVTWTDNNAEVYAQRYDANGVAQGGNTVVPTTTTGTQYWNDVAGYASGYAVVWSSSGNAGGNGFDIYLKRYDSAGNLVTAETRVSTVPGAPAAAQTGTQIEADVAAYANGNLVIVWTDQNSNDGNLYGVYGRLYNASAGTFSDTLLLNTTTTGYQYEPAVATLSDGGFVVVWRSDGTDGSSAGVYGQRFGAGGAKVGAEFLVNETTTGGQYQPDVTGLSTGGFVVSFYNDNYDVSGTGTTADVYIREYDAAGNPIDGQRKLVSPSNGVEGSPAIADLGSGNFIVVYNDYNTTANGGNNTYEIVQQIFGSASELPRPSAPPVIGDMTDQLTLSGTVATTLYAGNPQLIDPDVSVVDTDSANFAGGQLTVTLQNGATATEAIAVRNQGTGALQIGVSGANVTYGGTVIGTLAGGGAGGSSLTISFNADASAQAVQALVENITYQNTAPPAGTTDRYLGLRLTDGDGGVSDPRSVLVRIQTTATPTTLLLDDVVDSVALTETEANAGVLLDDAVQLNYAGATGFNGGKLTVSYLSATNRVDDQLTIRNVGSGPGQVAVSGSTVSYAGTAIGTISATLNGTNGTTLEITFNADATDQAIERVIENLQYRNSSDGPLETRTVRVVVTDGASVSSAVQDIAITIAPEADTGAVVPLFGEAQSNTYEIGQQTLPAVARLLGANAGGYVITWVSQDGQDGSGNGIFAQRYDANGSAVGAEFQVNSTTLGTQTDPAVAGLADGGYVITWGDAGGFDGSGYGIFAQRYNADGSAAGSEFVVNTTVISSQSEPAVLGLADGSFVITYRSDYSDAAGGYTYDVLGRRFAADGTPIDNEFTLNTLVSGTQYEPQLSALPTGGFVAVWTDTSGDASGYGIIAQRFDASGNKVGGEIPVNTSTTGTQLGCDVATLSTGGFVVVWHSSPGANSVYAQRFDAAGNKVGAEIIVATADTDSAYSNFARVVALDNGGFVVSWDANLTSVVGGNAQDVLIQQFDAAGNKVDGPQIVNSTTASAQYLPDIAALGGNTFVVTWAGYDQERAGTQSTYGVFHQLFGNAGAISRSTAPVLADVAAAIDVVEDAVNAAPQVIDPGVSLTDADSANFDGGRLWVSTISGYGDITYAQLPEDIRAQDQYGIRHQGNAAGQVGVSGTTVSYGGTAIGTIVLSGANGGDLVVQFNANATAAAVEAVIENLTYANSSSAPVGTRTASISVSDGDGGTSAPRMVTIAVTPSFDGAQPLFGNETVNTYQNDTQQSTAMSRLADGGYVIVWASNAQDGWGYGVYGQRFDANGVPVGAEFQAHTYTPNNQAEPVVAGLNGGGFVVSWTSEGQDGSSVGIYAQRFDANGVPQGGEFRVNTTTNQGQQQPTITATADGGFVIAWHHNYYDAGFTEYQDIYFQRYDANGVAQGIETRGNPAGQGTVAQSEPSLAALSGGGFVLTWSDASQDGSSTGVFGQRFSAAGVAVGGAFQVNTFTTNIQYESDVIGLTSGGFVVVWTSYLQDGSSYGVFGQRFDAGGAKVGDEFRVNTETSGSESDASVTALPDGGYAITWNDDNQIWVQQYAATGTRIDGPTRVDPTTGSTYGVAPQIQGLGNGAFVVAWQDYDYAIAQYQIQQQIFGNPADFPRQSNPELVDVRPSVTFDENDINAVPALIDPGVGLVDPDSANFDGGLLEVNYLTDYGAQDQLGLQTLTNQDQLGVRHQGNGPGQIGVAGTTISYGGVAIGSVISNGANGAKLAIQFNANATPEAVERLVENLTYANTVSNPIASRTVSIRITDGDGGASVPRNVVINVNPEVDGAVKLGIEKIVNTTVAGHQADPSVTRLADGGYVVVWEDQGGADGSLYGVYGQRYDANDNAVGTEFRVNTTTASYQYEPQVVGLNGGGFVVVWRSDGQDASGGGVYAQRYAADGSAAGGEFRVNTLTSGNQYQASIAATADGGFVVAWYNDYYNADLSSYNDVYLQRYSASGVPQGVETLPYPVNTTGQYQPSITGLAGGGFLLVWTDASALDGNGQGVFGQRFAANGAPVGTQFQVNSFIDSTQYQPSVASLKDGGWIVVWTSAQQDLSSNGVYAQRFDSNGAKLGAEFRVNTTISGSQDDAHVIGLENGGWVVSWSDGSDEVYVQQYNAAGLPVDGQTRVNGYNYSTQYQPAIASMADGGFVVAYTGYIASGDGDGDGSPDGGNNTYEIRLQRFSNTAPNVSDILVNAVEEQVTTLTSGMFETAFVDPDGQVLQAIKIVTLPGQGTLRLNGVAVTPDQEISIAALQAGQLTYQGNVDYFGADQFRWTGSDGISFAPTPVFTNIVISNVNDGPRLEAGPTGAASEGSAFVRTFTLDDPDPEGHLITVNWGDGSANTVFSTSDATPSIVHAYADNGSYTVTVTADDQQGLANSVETDSFAVNVANVAPTIGLSGANSVVQGEVYTLALGFPNDPGNDTVTEYRIDWNDGSPVQVISAASLPANRQVDHTFTTPGSRTIAVELVDEDGTFANAGTRAVTVSAPAEVLTVDAGADIAVNEGAFFSKTISFTDPTDQDPVGRTYTVTWGDGQTSSGNIAGGASSFVISHTYADGAANYVASVTVDDSGAQQGTDAFNVQVNNVAPTVSLSGGPAVEGSVYTLTLARNDPGADAAQQYVIRWGDGSEQTIAAAALPANGQVTHTYADGNQTVTVQVDVTDEDGTFVNAGTLNVFVANVAPTAAVTGADTVAEGASYTLTVGAVNDPGADTITGYTIDWGDGSTQNFNAAQWAAAAGSFNHTYADGGSGGSARTINVSATDEDGSFTLGSKSLTVGNVAPLLALAGAASTNEGASYTLNIAGSDAAGAADPLSYTIDWGDGSAVQNLTAAQLAALAGNVTHVFADDQDGAVNSTPRTISVTADDGDGGTTTQTQVVAVDNVAPTIALNGAASAQVGVAYTLNLGAVTDPGTDTVSQYLIDWGDGSAVQTVTSAGNVAHTYTSTGNRTISVSLVDEDGTFANPTTVAVSVAPATPTVSLEAGADANVAEGGTFSRTIAFGDGQDNGAAGWSYTIDYGDGTVVNGTTAVQSIELNHVYADGNASRNVTVSVTDVAGETASDGFVVNVANVAPTAAVTGADTVAEGASYTLTVGAVNEPGADTITGYTIDWGDGSTQNFNAAQWAAAAGSFSHTYADGGSGGTGRTINVSATDEDGSFTLGSKSLTVSNVAPQLALAGAASTNEGASYTLNIAGSDAAGAADPLSYTIDWGDGSAVQNLTAAQLAALAGNVTHVFADDQDGAVNSTPRTISVTADDGDGGTTTQTQVVAVDNVAPTAAVTGADAVAEGASYTLDVGAVNDPGADTISGYTIDWGDGSTQNFSASQWAAAAGSFSHTYADGGNGGTGRTITVSGTDEDGTFTLGSKSLTVSNVAPLLALAGAASTNEGASYTLNIAGSDAAGAADPLSYTIDWGDGSAVQNLTAAQLAALAGNVTHVFADDQDGAVNSTPRTISVTADDGDGGTTTQTQLVAVDNVAPTIALNGAASAQVGVAYTLNLGAVTDPGTDTVSQYLIDWGDGSAVQTVTSAGNVAHTYTAAGNRTISVSLVDEDGSFANPTTVAVSVAPATPTVSLEAGADANVAEGGTFSRTIAFGDGQDNGDVGWNYTIDYGDGTVVNGTTAVQSIELNHVYADGSASRNVSVSVTDVAGETASDGFVVNVANVAPTAAATGADTVAEGASYTLTVGAVNDPGADTITSYTIDWGDGSTQAFSAAQWAAAGGGFSHTYADGGNGGTGRTINVSATDEDGSFTLGSKSLTVTNVAPLLALAGAGSTNEGAGYTLNITGSDAAGAADPLSYTIDWGDGSAVQNLTAAQLAALSGIVTHVFADDQDGAVNSTPRTISVTADDGDGGTTTQTQVVTVANVAPTAAVTGADTVAEGASYTLTVGAVNDPGVDTITGYTIDWGDGSTQAFSTAQWAAAAGSFNHTYADGGSGGSARTINVSATDEDGTFTLGSKSLTVTNVAPLLALAGAVSTNEGASYTLNIAGSDAAGAADPLSYTIDWGDGSAVQNLTAAQLAALAGNVTHVFADDQDGAVNSTPRTISVTADDGDGGTTTQTQVVAVDNVAPTIALNGAASAQVGVAYTLNLGAVTDPGIDTVSQYLIDWGDGSAVQTVTSAGNVAHTYTSTGNRTISVSLVDEDGTFANPTTVAVSVAPATPTVSLEAGADANVAEGGTFSRTIAFGDGQDNGAAGWSYTIDYGDGTVVNGTTAVQSIELNHVYADGNASRNVTVSVTDVAGETASDGFVVNVANVAPTAAVTGADTVAEGASYTLTVGAVNDPGADTITGYTIDWGDGSTQNFNAAQWAAAAGSFSHTYADGGSGGSARTINVSATDEDGTFTLGSKSLTVSNVAPQLALAGAASTNEGASYTLNIAGSDAAGAADPLSYTIDWGDGSAVQNLTAAQLAALAGNVTHLFADDQDGAVNSTPRTISVTADDGDGGTTTQTQVVAVDNVAPTAAVTGADTVAEGTSYTLTVGAVNDPGADTITGYTIDWGDGSTQAFTAAQWTAAAGSFNHTYADGGSGGSARTINVSATDEDGTFTLGSKSLTVSNVAPQLALAGAASTNEGASYTLNIAGSDAAGAADPLSYTIDWGDGSAVQNLTAAQLAALAGNVTHVFADDQDGAVNSTPRTISVTADDGDGGTTTQTQVVAVDNVAPTIALNGAASAQVGVAYTLNLGAVTDPGIDTVSLYLVDWGDGSTTSTSTVVPLTHTYATSGAYNISVSLTDEDGTYAAAGSLAVSVAPATPTVSLEAGADANVAEGGTFSRTIAFGDGQDNGAAGWSYTIDYGDGTVVNGTTAVQSIELNHVYADGNASRNVTVSVTDVAGETASDGFVVNVANVAPTAAVTGADTVAEGTSYTLTVGAVNDPGADTITGYTIDWGDGSTQAFTAAQWTAAAGSFNHTYADGGSGGSARTINVSATDEDGTFTLGSKSLTVSNVAPQLALAGAASTNEGASYTLNIAGSDAAGAADPLSYTIDWGDGSAVQNLTAAQLAALAGNVTHVFADDQDGAVNSTPRTISVTADDGDGGTTTQTQVVAVDNVAPTIALNGAASAQVGVAYTLNLGAVTDPGTDTVSQYLIDWGDGSAVQTVTSAGNVAHTYTSTGNRTISVSLVDEDGTFANPTTVAVSVAPATPTNASPIADDESYAIYAGQTLIVSAPGVLVGDTDADGDALQVVSVQTGSLQGTLTQNADGSFTFAANAGFVGTTGYDYVVSDGKGGTDTGHVSIDVQAVPIETVKIGNAPVRQTGTGGQWAAAWSAPGIGIAHKADVTNAAENWSAVSLSGVSPQTLAGLDILSGDLGVSGQSAPTSTVRQEIDGREALRFNLDREATEVTVNLSRFFVQDDGSVFVESGRLRLFDSAGNVVGETTFRADGTGGVKQVTLGAAEGFSAVEISAGVYDGSTFVFGGYANTSGGFGSAITTDATGGKHGSDFLVDWIEFDFPTIGVPAPEVHG